MILVVVCHPDDEALWFGGSLHALSQFPACEVNVICLSGRDPASPREQEFHAAQRVAGYAAGVVVGFPLRKAHEPLPNIASSVEEGLTSLDRTFRDVELLITHSPYGDEHRHPHHVQAFQELHAWSNTKGVPFGFFSSVALPIGSVRSLLRSFRRQGTLHLLQLGQCHYGFRDRLSALLYYGAGWMPRYLVQLQTDSAVKRAMLECYPSVDLPLHKEGYAMFTANVELIYLRDRAALSVLETFIAQMKVPGPPDLFAQTPRVRRLASTLYRRMKRALHS